MTSLYGVKQNRHLALAWVTLLASVALRAHNRRVQ